LNKQDLEQRVLALLAASPGGFGSPALQNALKVSQPTVARLLMDLRARGLVISEGSARARRYHAVQGRLDVAALRSRLLHERIARKLTQQPDFLPKVKARLQKLKQINPAGNPYHKRWQSLIDGPLPGLLRKLTEDSEDAALLRKESPFTVLITPAERKAIFAHINPEARK
jgi:DNA-binding MarR family transcriptional regulator